MFPVEDGENVPFDHGSPQFAAVVVPDGVFPVSLADDGDFHVIMAVHRRGRSLIGIAHADRDARRTFHRLDRIRIHKHSGSRVQTV